MTNQPDHRSGISGRVQGHVPQVQGVIASAAEKASGSQQADRVIGELNEIIGDAARAGASDIHIEPVKEETLIRYRIDGLLQVKKRIPNDLLTQYVSRIKIMAKLDTTEHRHPLDGRIDSGSLPQGIPPIDIRVSTLPVLKGEKCCLRLIYKSRDARAGLGAGLSDHNQKIYKDLVESPVGLLLYAGPAGSGKTTAAYAAIHQLNNSNRNISTVEDPIEYEIAGVNQSQVNSEIGLTFDKILRALLRQDCNVILVGEVRDAETCEISIEAGLTGHKIIGTIHASSAIGTVARLQEMGIARYFIGSALTGVVSQRLVRRLCDRCKKSTVPPQKLAEALQIDPGRPIFQAVGCRACMSTGYRGRVPIHEIFKPDDTTRGLIYNGASPLEIEAAALQSGASAMVPLWVDGIEKAKTGETSVEEILRVVKGIAVTKKA